MVFTEESAVFVYGRVSDRSPYIHVAHNGHAVTVEYGSNESNNVQNG
jgi:hypothetical protein